MNSARLRLAARRPTLRVGLLAGQGRRLAAALATLVWLACAPQRPEPPNVILIVSDDQGWADLGANRSLPDVATPQLDRLAGGGARFPRGYAMAPVCRPSRVAILTGRYPQRFEGSYGEIPEAERTLAERLGQAGYVAGMVGKWQLDAAESRRFEHRQPRRFGCAVRLHGFVEYFCGSGRSILASHTLSGEPLADADQRRREGGFRVAMQTRAALAFLERHRDERFFLYLAYSAPHTPVEAPDENLRRFAGVEDEVRRKALAMISAVDDGIGRILDWLASQGLEERTLVFFVSDNGAPLAPGSRNGSRNDPLVGEKGMLTDGGLRVPFLAAWKGVIRPGSVYDQAVSTLDIAATANAAAGLPPDPQMDGVDLLPYLLGDASGPPHEVLYWRWRSQGAVLAGGWKLIRIGSEQRLLFDLESAAGETLDRAAAEPQRADALERRLVDWASRLEPPGLPQEAHRSDRALYARHLGPLVPAEPAGPPDGG